MGNEGAELPLTEVARHHPALRGDNAYLREVLTNGICTVGMGFRWPPDWDYMTGMDRPLLRFTLVREYAWAIPNDDALEALLELGPLVEIGAGGGYWAYLLRERGADVIAYDPELWRETEKHIEREQGEWTPVLKEDALAAAKHPDRALIICWPSYDNAWADEGLKHYRGQTVAYIGESDGGCCANDDFFAHLYENFEMVAEIAIPQWEGVHDALSIWRRS